MPVGTLLSKFYQSVSTIYFATNRTFTAHDNGANYVPDHVNNHYHLNRNSFPFTTLTEMEIFKMIPVQLQLTFGNLDLKKKKK